MNDDELRAFLDSATVGGDDDAQDSGPEAPEESSQFDAETPTALLTPPVVAPPVVSPPVTAQPGQRPAAVQQGATPPATPQQAAPAGIEKAAQPPSAVQSGPSFDDLVRGTSPQGSVEPTPIVLPGPQSARKPPETRLYSTAGGTPLHTPSAAAAPPVQTTSTPQAPASVTVPPAALATPQPAATSPVGREPATAAFEPQAAAPATSQLPKVEGEYEKIAVTGGKGDRSKSLPWIIVGAGAAVAIIASLFVVNAMRGGSEPAPVPPTTTTETSSPTSGQTTTSPGPTKPTPTSTAGQVPPVDVGPTMNMPVTQWNIQVDLSQRLGQTYYQLEGDKLLLSTALIDSLPASCAKQPWGMSKIAGGKFEVLKPTQKCAAAPELYDELWGLMDAMVKTARPL